MSLGEGIDCTTAAGRVQLHVLAALAEFERARIAERVRAGLARVRASGKRLGRPAANLGLADIMRTIAQLADEGIISGPKFIPPQFADLNALTAWMCYANFFNRLSMERIESDYSGLL